MHHACQSAYVELQKSQQNEWAHVQHAVEDRESSFSYWKTRSLVTCYQHCLENPV